MTDNSANQTVGRGVAISDAAKPLSRFQEKFRRFWIYKVFDKIYQQLLINISEVPNAKIFQLRYSKDWRLGSIWLIILFVSAMIWVLSGFIVLYMLK